MKTQLEQNYQQALKNVEDSKIALKVAIDDLLKNGRPCEKGDKVTIVKASGEKIVGIVNTFVILRCEKVYVTSLKVGDKTIYISDPYKSII